MCKDLYENLESEEDYISIYIYIFRDLYENLESEEEYMRDEERKLIAVIKIQVNTKYFEFS